MNNVNLTGIVNESLIRKATMADFIARGFVKVTDGTGSPWGVSYDLKTAKFWVTIDCNFIVKVARLDPDSDFITVLIDDLHDLDCLLDWIAE